jgi:hypothetical protein
MHLAKVTGLRYAGSFSWAALPHMAKFLGQHPCQAWEQRHQNRQLWKDELDRLRTKDQCFLARLVIASGDVAAGLRDKAEIQAVRDEKLFNHIVWVHRPGTPVDPTVTYEPGDCDSTLLNAGGLCDFYEAIEAWARTHNLPLI